MSDGVKSAVVGSVIAVIGAFLLYAIQSWNNNGEFTIIRTTLKKHGNYESIDFQAVNNSKESVFIKNIKFDIKKKWHLKIDGKEKSFVTPSAVVGFDFHPYKDEVSTPDDFAFVVKKGDPERIQINIHGTLAEIMREPFFALVGVSLITNKEEIFLDHFLFNFNAQGVFYATSSNEAQIKEILKVDANKTNETINFLKQLLNS